MGKGVVNFDFDNILLLMGYRGNILMTKLKKIKFATKKFSTIFVIFQDCKRCVEVYRLLIQFSG